MPANLPPQYNKVEEEYRKAEVGSNVLTGEAGYSVIYRTWARPTLEVHGMPGGFVGADPDLQRHS